MPRAKVTFKETVLDLEVRDLECTVGPEILKAGHLKASLDVADLLRAEISPPRGTGVTLHAIGPKKINVIKIVRTFTRLGLKEAKSDVESTPVSWTGFDPGEAQKFLNELKAAEANAELITGNDRPTTILDKLREMIVEAMSK